jgi:hypothetical protein
MKRNAYFTGKPELARESGKRGAKVSAMRRKKWLDPHELPELNSVEAAQTWLEVAGRACGLGRITSSQSNSICKAASEYLQSLEVKEALEELEELRALVRPRAAS